MKVLIVTPESPTLPLGNTITATRWAGILRTLGHEVDIAEAWNGEDCDLLIALHARRSAESVQRSAAWAAFTRWLSGGSSRWSRQGQVGEGVS